MRRPSRGFAWGLVAIAAVGLAVRLAYIFVERSGTGLNPALGAVGGDAFFYAKSAWLLPDHGFISPEIYLSTGRTAQSAEHPPMYLLWLTIPSLFGVVSAVAQMLWSTVLGVTTIVLVGLLGREVRNEATGLVAAALAAVYPNVWSHDGFLTSETMALCMVTLTLLLAYRYWREPSTRRLFVLGIVCAFATLSRAELGLLFLFVVLPLALRRTQPGMPGTAKRVALAALAGLIPIAPWIAFNAIRFEQPVYLSTGFGVTLASANCDATYYAPYTGYWNMQCAQRIREDLAPGLDQSEQDPIFRREALDYVGDHTDRLPSVIAARWGRISSLWMPWQQAGLDQFPEGREGWVANTSLVMWWLLLPFALAGIFVLRARRVPVYPLLALPATVLVAITLTFATTRYRATMETVMCVLAACALVALFEALRDRRGVQLDLTASDVGARAVPAPTG